ncbi:recombination endonuclease [Leptolyngbya phage LPP-2, strain SPI]|uniref:Recombination endonuclease n=1 Tax=Leptolyngbya phage LPP-2, strain SPI TaxID=2996053 RepID=A0AAE9TIB0_9CAUD|nr:recombination endonuclease [Leptolyngbya phage LPP-2 st. SPI]
MQETLKRCRVCEELKPLTEFWKESRRKDGYRLECIPCQKKQQKGSKISKDLREYLYKKQNGMCPICEQSLDEVKVCVDHCHDTNNIRGLLCDPCNRSLSKAFNKPQTLLRAYTYLTQN